VYLVLYTDVKLVGKRKAIGYLSYFARRTELFMVPMQEQEQELEVIADELTARGMEVYWDHSKEDRGHQAEIAALCKQLPPRLYCRKLCPSYHRIPCHMRQFFAVDPLVISSARQRSSLTRRTAPSPARPSICCS